MPAPKKQNSRSIVEYLNSLARKFPVSQTIPVNTYYRSADLLLSQAALYKAAHNEEQQYLMLMRLISLVVETIPEHKKCLPTSHRHLQYRQKALEAFQQAEILKQNLLAHDNQEPTTHVVRRPSNTVQITDADSLPDIDWDAAAAPPPEAAAAAAAGIPADYVPLSADLEWPPRSAGSVGSNSSAVVSAGQHQQQQQQQHWDPVQYSSLYTASSQQTVQKHALFGPKSSTKPLQQSSSLTCRPRYPTFDSTPIDALWSQGNNTAAAAAGISSLSINGQQQQSGSFIDAALPPPSAGPSLGPQEIEVQSMQPCGAEPGGTCAVEPVSLPSVQEAAAAAAAGPKKLTAKKYDLRDVHISVALMNDFLHYAANNTRRGIESCGILAGCLSAADGRFTVTTLIVPKQTGTSDTVEMLGEEEVWEAESSRELVPLGWIHTHPTQTCFLSSVDIHTQCGYQTMLDEAVAIVMAPTDNKRRCGIFRLTTPLGLEHVQKCTYRGFHASCNSEMYELCGHVYLNPNAKHDVIDLR